MKKITTVSDICTHLEDDYDRYSGAIVPPLFQNSLFTSKEKDHGYSYTRSGNPTLEILEKKLAALEKAEAALVFSSGMGAITSVLSCFLGQGDHVIALNTVYPPAAKFIKNTLRSHGVESSFVRYGTVCELEEAVRPQTRVVYLESPSSFVFRIQNLREIAEFCKTRGILTVIDNTCATPLYQNPLELGIDIVVHSATKYLGGHSDVIVGAAMGSREHMDAVMSKSRVVYGACADPFAAWLLIRSLRTFELRVAQHGMSGMKAAEYLDRHPRVKKVYYPGLPGHENHELAKTQMRGFTGLLSVVLDADEESALRFTKKLELFEVGPSWGGFESLTLPLGFGETDKAFREFQGVPEGLIRMSIGLESIDSILSDLENALGQL